MAWLGLALGASLVTVGACDTEGSGSTTGTVGTGGSATGTGGSGGSLPEGITIAGLSGPVSAVYDEHGLLHLSCATDDDCYSALGYFHAQNRFFFMDFVRNLVRGRLGSLVSGGATVLEVDYANRLVFTNADGEPLEELLYEASSATTKGHMDAYTVGVNAWIANMRAGEHDATLTDEYNFPFIEKEAIRDWEPEDSAAIGLFVLNDLSNSSESELLLADSIPLFDPALAADLFSPEPVFDAAALPATMMLSAPQPDAATAAIATASERMTPLHALVDQALAVVGRVGANAMTARRSYDYGSNNWAVMGSRTTSGNAILADDPHLDFFNPSIWFAVELDAKSDGSGDTHVAGSTFPGLPSVMVGHNEDVAWGVTTAYWDLTDIYTETLTNNGTTVSFNGIDIPIVEKDFVFEDISTGTPITRTFRYVPHHGPILAEMGNTALSLRWRGAEATTDLDAFFALSRAASVDEARQGVEDVTSANQNFVVIDMEGNLGWYPYVDVPERSWASLAAPPWLPIPGDGSAEWGPAIAKATLPQATNPVSGAVATANQDHTGATFDGDPFNDGQAAVQVWFKASGTRMQRILDLLEADGDAHSVSTMNAMHGDTYSLFGEVVVPAALTAAAGMTPTAAEQAVIDALTAWQLTCPTGLDGSDPVAAMNVADATVAAESIGCTAFHTVLYAAVHEALGDEITAAGADIARLRADLHLVVRAIADPGSVASGPLLWDDVTTTPAVETQDEILQRAISAAATLLVQSFGADPDDWRWGRTHTMSLFSIFDQFGFDMYNEGPFAAPGGQYTVNVANPTSRALPEGTDPIDWSFGAGPSVRFVVEATPSGMQMTYQLPGGNDLHRDSDFYNNLLPRWLEVESIDFPFGPGAVPTPALELQVHPAP
ncbi:MAG: penicillin acylase family protein [Polyangiaceae bacterium]